MEKEGKLYLIAPLDEYAIGRTESSLKKRADLYDHGYKLIQEKFDEMKAFLK